MLINPATDLPAFSPATLQALLLRLRALLNTKPGRYSRDKGTWPRAKALAKARRRARNKQAAKSRAAQRRAA